jgi:ribose transport system substrate-binding protein
MRSSETIWNRWPALALIALATLVATGCGAGDTAADKAQNATAPGTAKAELDLCVIDNKSDHPSIQAIHKGMDDTAKHYPVKIEYFDPNLDPQRQNAQIDDCIARKFDAILLDAVDPAAVVPGIKKASDAQIPVVMHNADTNDEGRKLTATFVTPDLYAQGVAVGSVIAETMPSDAKMVIISGVPGQTGVAERINGAKESLKGTNIEFLDDQAANWDKDKALQVMQAYLTRYPDVAGVYALDDFMALGALEAIKAAGKQDKIKVYGVGGAKDACQAIKAGELQGSAIHLSYMVGVHTVRAAWDVAHGLPVPKLITFPSIGLDPDNVAEYEELCW